MSLYRKYRPANFANLVGQDHARQTLLNEIKSARLSHAYLFAGPRGTGKTTTARLIAKAINCGNRGEEGEPCDKCEFCTLIAEGNLIDVVEIDAASNRGIDEIRDLREKIKFAPTRSLHKVYIIDEVHMLTKEAFNALLKTLEEPPPNVYFILATTEVHKIPETIISRCQRFDFKRINLKTVMTRLQYIAQKEDIEAEDKAIELIARSVGGSLRDAITLLEQMVFDKKLTYEHVRAHLGVTGHHTIQNLCDLLFAREYKKALHLIHEVHNEGYDLDSFVRDILESLREMLLHEIETVDQQGKMRTLLLMIEVFLEAKENLKRAPIPQLPLEIALIKICMPMDKMTSVAELESGHEKKTSSDAKSPKKKNDATGQETSILEKLLGTEESPHAEEATAAAIKNELSVRENDTDAIEPHKTNPDVLWPRIVEQIQPPSLRRSFREGKVISLDDQELNVGFSSQFHLEKIRSAESMNTIETVLQSIFKKPVRLVCSLQKVELRAPEDQAEPAPVEKAPDEDIGAQALKIFGGEEL